MTCWRAKRRIAEYVDRRLPTTERSRVAAHLAECESCSLEFEQVSLVRSTLAELPVALPPASLRAALQVKASQQRRTISRHNGSRFQELLAEWKFRVDQLMRPLTIPATGGILSSFILFGALALTIGTTTRGVTYEVPVMYADHMNANLVPMELRSSVVLNMILDGNGRITDYSVQDSSASYVGNPMRLQGNNISLPAFSTVLAVAHPVTRDISIKFTPLVFRQ